MRERKSRRSATTTTTLTCSSIANMVPQQTSNGSRADSPTNTNGQPTFGSQLVDRKSSTPYSDATQVGIFWIDLAMVLFLSPSSPVNVLCVTQCAATCLATVREMRRKLRLLKLFVLRAHLIFFSVVITSLRVLLGCACVCLCVCAFVSVLNYQACQKPCRSLAKVMFSLFSFFYLSQVVFKKKKNEPCVYVSSLRRKSVFHSWLQ